MTDRRTDSLALELAIPAEVRSGDALIVTMRVHNRSGSPRDLYLRGRAPTLDVVITRPGGDTVWQRLRGEVIPASLMLRTLGAGDTLVVEATWDQRTPGGAPAPPGEYLARGLLLTDGEPLATAPVSFRITSR